MQETEWSAASGFPAHSPQYAQERRHPCSPEPGGRREAMRSTWKTSLEIGVGSFAYVNPSASSLMNLFLVGKHAKYTHIFDDVKLICCSFACGPAPTMVMPR